MIKRILIISLIVAALATASFYVFKNTFAATIQSPLSTTTPIPFPSLLPIFTPTPIFTPSPSPTPTPLTTISLLTIDDGSRIIIQTFNSNRTIGIGDEIDVPTNSY